MKKTLWMLGVAVAALTSCTQSEVVDIPESRTIQFEPFVGKSTRAADVKANMLVGAAGENNDLKSFWVFGNYDGSEGDDTPFNGGDDSKVYWDDQNRAFKYNNARQWHMGTYKFAAYSNGNEKIDETGAAFSYDPTPTLTFANYVNNGNRDLVAAIPTAIVKDQTNMETGVSLDFKHMLACIELEFTNNSSVTGGYYLDFQNLKFIAKSTATCTYTSLVSWTNLVEESEREYEFITNTYDHNNNTSENNDPTVLLGPSDKANFYCFVIPQSNQDIELTFKIASYTRAPKLDSNGDEEKDANGNTVYDYTYTSTEPYRASLSITGDHSSWKPGILYKYTAGVSGETHYINFTVSSFEQWTTTAKPSVDTPISPADNSNSGI